MNVGQIRRSPTTRRIPASAWAGGRKLSYLVTTLVHFGGTERPVMTKSFCSDEE